MTILYESKNKTYFVVDAGKKGFEVYRNGVTAATRCASIGRSLGLARAIAEADKRDIPQPRPFP